MALQFEDQNDLTLGESRIRPRDVYVRPAVDPNAGQGMMQLAKALDSFSGTLEQNQNKAEQQQAALVPIYGQKVYNAISRTGAYDAGMIDDATSDLFAANRALATQYAGIRIGNDFANNYEMPEDILTNPEAAAAWRTKVTTDAQAKYGNVPFLAAGVAKGVDDVVQSRITSMQSAANDKENTEIIDGFKKGIKGAAGESPVYNPTYSTDVKGRDRTADAQLLLQFANKWKISPFDAALIISFETSGSFDPDQPNSNPKSKRFGLLSFGTTEQEAFGITKGMTFADQLAATEKFLMSKGLKEGMDLKALYRLINNGIDGKGGADDSGRTFEENIAKMKKDNAGHAAKFLGLQGGPDDKVNNAPVAPGPSGDAGGIVDMTAQASDPRWQTFGQLQDVKGFVIHHTAGRGDVAGVINTFKQRGYPAQYVIDRDGKIYQTLPDGARGQQIRTSPDGQFSNANTIGVEVIAKNDSDVTPAQVEAAKRLFGVVSQKYGLTADQVYGHGELNPGHKEATEGITIKNAIQSSGVAGTQYASLDTGTMNDASPAGSTAAPTAVADASQPVEPVVPQGAYADLPWDAMVMRSRFFEQDGELKAVINGIPSKGKLKGDARQGAAEVFMERAHDTGDIRYLQAFPANQMTDKITKQFEAMAQTIKQEKEAAANQAWTAKVHAEDDNKRNVQLEMAQYATNGQEPDAAKRQEWAMKYPGSITEWPNMKTAILDPNEEQQKYNDFQDQVRAAYREGKDPRRVDVGNIKDPNLRTQAGNFARDYAEKGGEYANKDYEDFWSEQKAILYGSASQFGGRSLDDPKMAKIEQDWYSLIEEKVKAFEDANPTKQITKSVRIGIANEALDALKKKWTPNNSSDAENGNAPPAGSAGGSTQSGTSNPSPKYGFGSSKRVEPPVVNTDQNQK